MVVPMTSVLPQDLDFLVARLHGRRRRLAEAERLDALCRLRTIPDLARAVGSQVTFYTAGELQHWLILQLVEELADFTNQLRGAGAALTEWMRVRFQIENLKVLARAFATGRSLDSARSYLVPLPDDLSLDIDALAAADSVELFAAAAPAGRLRQSLVEAAAAYAEAPSPIVLEFALDRGYYCELIKRAKSLPMEPRHDSMTIVRQEVDTFHLMLVARGRFTYGLPAEQLVQLHVDGGAISRNRFRKMLVEESLLESAQRAVGFALDPLPAEERGLGEDPLDLVPAVLEALAWNRYLRLSHRAFRHSHMGLGAVIAFAAIRRIELANLITLSEGIRAGVDPEAIRSRLVPTDTEAIRV
jgi:vacuolar-type H+-ATPase subunit C/Vma6